MGYRFTPADWLHWGFFASHIPITLFLDSQAVLPRRWFPSWALSLNEFYVSQMQDPLMGRPPAWFQGMVATELLLQLPFFFAALYAMHTGGSWIRLPAIAYSAHVSTTLVPVLAHVLFGEDAMAPSSLDRRLLLAAIYSPYLLIPLHYGWTMFRRKQPYVQNDYGQEPYVKKYW